MIGLDFGTTNSAIAVARDGEVELAQHRLFGTPTTTFRSLLYLSIDERESMRVPGVFAGPAAIEQYLEEGATGRFVQSLKSLLPSPTFESTQVLGTSYTLEELIALIVGSLRARAEAQFGALDGVVVAGRPVAFVGADTPEEDARAEARLRDALALAGFPEVVFELEPIAAAYSYARRLTTDETLLVADFGGGTSDFCVQRVGPGAATLPARERILATDGVGLAGDRFDARIVEARIAPLLGRGGQYRGMTGEAFDIPDWLYRKLASWHDLSFLRSGKPLETLRDMARYADAPEKLASFLTLVENNLGYYLYDAVEATKRGLSDESEARLAFDDAGLDIDERITRGDFEGWIQDELDQICLALDRCLGKAGTSPSDIDRVFMTGGTSFVPAVRELFEDTFGPEKLADGEALSSVATGLALRAEELGGRGAS